MRWPIRYFRWLPGKVVLDAQEMLPNVYYLQLVHETDLALNQMMRNPS